MEKVNYKKAQKRGKHYLLYVLSDFLVTAFFVFLSYLSIMWAKIIAGEFEQSKFWAVLIFSGIVAALVVGASAIFGVYKILTRNFGLLESAKIALIVFIVKACEFIYARFNPGEWLPQISIFVWILSMFCTIFIIPSARLIFRLGNILHNYFGKRNVVRTMVIGAGSSAKIAIDETRNNPNINNKVVVVVDDDEEKINHSFSSIPVEGPIANVEEIIKKYNVEEVIIAISTLSKTRLHEILSILMSSNVRIKRMPLLSEMDGPNDIKITSVDLDELLCRPAIVLDNSKVNDVLKDKVVMVTGAGGSIGSELVRQIFNTHPKTLVLFDIYENSTYDIQQELNIKMRKENIHDVEIITLIGSTYNEKRVEQVIKKYKPEFIYHAAAYKHVPLMEDSPAEAIRTNVIGTYNVAKVADKYGVKKMVLVSTDKAVRPTNVMGATKRFAETIIQYFAEKSKNTSYAAVRFGNVLGSNGSVVPLFKKQLESGGPITITDKNIIRYFMTIPEAVSLILQCGLFAVGGEIFILDMGKPVKIIDLAEKMIRQSGKVPYKDIEIVETGLRPGEKLYEELLIDKTTQEKTENKKIFIEKRETIRPIEEQIVEITKVFDLEENNDIKKLLASIITTYSGAK